MKKKLSLRYLLPLVICLLFPAMANAHCEIPCGIYGDKMRIDMIKEDITTVEKSMNQIVELSKASVIDYNQLVRWINNKEEHANKIQDIATQYFMFQRVKLTDDPMQEKKNGEMLKLLHELCVYAMKSKQSSDLNNVEKMKMVTDKFAKLYLGEDYGQEHGHK